MATVMDRGEMTTIGRGRPGAARPSRRPITLYDLITAIQDVVGPEDDRLVVATMRHLLQSGRLTWLGEGRQECVWASHRERGMQGSVAHCCSATKLTR